MRHDCSQTIVHPKWKKIRFYLDFMRMWTGEMEKIEREKRRKIFNVYSFCHNVILSGQTLLQCVLCSWSEFGPDQSRPEQTKAQHKLIFYSFMLQILGLHYIFPLLNVLFSISCSCLDGAGIEDEILYFRLWLSFILFKMYPNVWVFRIPNYPSENWQMNVCALFTQDMRILNTFC